MSLGDFEDLWCDRRWLKLATRPHARGVFAGGLSLAGRREDGLLTEEDVRLLAPSARTARKAAKDLVEVGLWEETPNGFRPLLGAPANDHVPTPRASVSEVVRSSGPSSSAARMRAYRERLRQKAVNGACDEGCDVTSDVTGVTSPSVTCDVTSDRESDVTCDVSSSLSSLSSLGSTGTQEAVNDGENKAFSPSSSSTGLSLFQEENKLTGHDRARGDAVNAHETKKKRHSFVSSDVQSVFDHWVTERGKVVKNRGVAPRLDAKRARLISDRLGEGYRVEDLKAAISGACVTPHNRGENEHGKVYLDLELLLRDGGHIERYALDAPKPRRIARPLPEWSATEELKRLEANGEKLEPLREDWFEELRKKTGYA